MSAEEHAAPIEETVDHVAERANRHSKLEAMKSAGVHPYPARFDKTTDLVDAKKLEENAPVKTAGRIVLFRQMGSITLRTSRISPAECR